MDDVLIEDCFDVLKRENLPPELVRRFTISNDKISVQVITYGATVTSIRVPDREGNIEDVVLGFDDVKGYLNHSHYFGATIGRVANRIGKSCFTLNGTEYKLNANDGANHLHGGLKGFDKVLWDSHVEGKTVIFSYLSPSSDENYPGEVNCRVTYELSDEGGLVVRYKATATQRTPINLTNHSYINLGGHHSGKIYDHIITINADYYTPVDEALVPTGTVLPVTNTVYDFRKPKSLGTSLSKLPGGKGFDINFCISGTPGIQSHIAKLYDPRSGRCLEVHSTQPGVQLYTANSLPSDNSLCGKGGNFYKKYGAVCLETQSYPDAVNNPNFPSCVIDVGDVYSQTTIYKFYTE